METSQRQEAHFELHFEALYTPGRGYSFPCDAAGRVNLDSMSDRCRESYLYARAVVGFELRPSVVRRCFVTLQWPAGTRRRLGSG